jgi:hypothetical protein
MIDAMLLGIRLNGIDYYFSTENTNSLDYEQLKIMTKNY